MKIILYMFLCLVLAIFPGGCSVLERGPQASPEILMQTYLEAFAEHDFETMFQLTADLEAGEEELSFIKNFIQMIELESYTIAQVDFLSDSEAVVPVTVKLRLMGHEKTQTTRVRVVQKEGKWFVKEGILEEDSGTG